jgi:hypothetical protein
MLSLARRIEPMFIELTLVPDLRRSKPAQEAGIAYMLAFAAAIYRAGDMSGIFEHTQISLGVGRSSC